MGSWETRNATADTAGSGPSASAASRSAEVPPRSGWSSTDTALRTGAATRAETATERGRPVAWTGAEPRTELWVALIGGLLGIDAGRSGSTSTAEVGGGARRPQVASGINFR